MTDTTPAEACAAQGGTFKPVGRAQTMRCVLNYSDAGKICSDSSQCQGDCLAEPATTGSTTAGSATHGRCAPTSDRFGCRTEIRNGVAQPTLCID
ncbi:hypothetical protein [Brevundimonas sp. UBA5866]|uniref:hypothetical protein n=1 Tax=Brevundimonas sp. UBA5866 TaxID=1946132 RepID=UPI0025C00FB9|nr:hypothetical protein [Brevundimonas sp. UBA5866]